MLEQVIIKQFNTTVKSAIRSYEEKYNSGIQFMLERGDSLKIDVLSDYKKKETIGIGHLNIPMIPPKTVEKKIITALEKLSIDNEIDNAKCMILIKNDNALCFLYDGGKPIRVIKINEIL